MCNRSIDLIYFFRHTNDNFSTRIQNIAIYLSESAFLIIWLFSDIQSPAKNKTEEGSAFHHVLPNVPSALLVVTTANADSPPHDLNPSAMESRGPLSGRTPSSGQPPPAIRLRSPQSGFLVLFFLLYRRRVSF